MLRTLSLTFLALSFQLVLLYPVALAGQTQTEWKDPITGIEFIWVPPGVYEMGCGSWTSDCEDDEKPVHSVKINGFWISKYETTQLQWKLVMGYNPSRFQKGGNFPAEMISWYDAKEFIVKLNDMSSRRFRLPTEAEWEYAARSGGKPEKYSGGNDLDRLGWYLENSQSSTNPVGKKAPNGLGLYDMTGNVWEWVEDIAHKYSQVRQDNPTVQTGDSKRIFRGGSWSYSSSEVRTSTRGEYFPDGRSSNLGFRLALD